jgi:hypothetical protein
MRTIYLVSEAKYPAAGGSIQAEAVHVHFEITKTAGLETCEK